MKLTRIYTGEDGLSRFEDLDVEVGDAGPIGRLSQRLPASGIIFRENDADYNWEWHNAPQRQYLVMLDGQIEIEVGAGEKRRFRGGDVLLLEDTTGGGHCSRTVDGRPRRSLFITLD